MGEIRGVEQAVLADDVESQGQALPLRQLRVEVDGMVPDLLRGQAAPAALRPAVDPFDEVGHPAAARFQERHLEAREPLEDPTEDHVGELAHLAEAMSQYEGLAAVSPHVVE